MKALFKQCIADFHADPLPGLTARDVGISELPESVRKAWVFVGMRRSGKTWGLFDYMEQLLAKGVTKQQLLYINFEDDRLVHVGIEDLDVLVQAYFELFPTMMGQKDVYFFFDEIHVVSGWELFIRRLLDKERMQIFITGSSAKMLSVEIASSLRGRSISREVFPFSFEEYLRHRQVFHHNPMTTEERIMLAHHLDGFLKKGGFPEVQDLELAMHREVLQGYTDMVIYRDIIERHGVRNVSALRYFLVHILHNPASLLSVNHLYNRLKSMGFQLSKDALYDYLDYLTDAYFIHALPLFHFSQTHRTLKPKKIYPNDQGLITAYSFKPEYEEGSQFETAVFLQLRRTCKDIFYYHTTRQKEVDFVIQQPNGQLSLVQACVDMSRPETREREVAALWEAMDELELDVATIVTVDQHDTITKDLKRIEVIRAVDWLLNG